MAELFIKVRHSLYDDEKANAIERALGLSKGQTVGLLGLAWIWASAHAPGGHAPGATHDDIDKATVEGFAAAMEAVGWLDSSKPGLYFPHFDRHNINTKGALLEVSRRKTREKVARHRARQKQAKDTAENVTDVTVTDGYKRLQDGYIGTPPYKKNLEKENEKVTPPTPSEGVSGRGGKDNSPEEAETSAAGAEPPMAGRQRHRGEILAVADDPELAAQAKKVVKHYKAKVRTAHPDGGAVLLVMNLLAAGTDEAHLCRRCDRYGEHCDKNETPLAKRQGAGSFFGPSGHHSSFDDDSAAEQTPRCVLPPRPVGRLHKPKRPEEMTPEEHEEYQAGRKIFLSFRKSGPPPAPEAKTG